MERSLAIPVHRISVSCKIPQDFKSYFIPSQLVLKKEHIPTIVNSSMSTLVETQQLLKGSGVDVPSLLNKVEFIVRGQCTVSFRNPSQEGFLVVFFIGNKTLVLSIESETSPKESALFLVDPSEVRVLGEFQGVRVDKDSKAPYWVSYYGKDWKLKYDVGEARQALALVDFDLSKTGIFIQCYPVIIEPPLRVLSKSLFTIEVLARNEHCSPADLTDPCQKLYNNIAGRNFILNSSDFPDFTQAIERSIKCKNGWCHKKIIEKAASHDPENPNTKETYLRITLGVNKGSSPGIPYVVEIWPPGHCSPIHAHGQAHAVIRVLYGKIQVELYSMLSPEHTTPFKTTTFEQDDVTWISPELNQTHKLTNLVKHGSTCITIQCYMYGEEDREHYPYFDYLHQDELNQFDPASDADYLEFKQIMQQEWENAKPACCCKLSMHSNRCRIS